MHAGPVTYLQPVFQLFLPHVALAPSPDPQRAGPTQPVPPSLHPHSPSPAEAAPPAEAPAPILPRVDPLTEWPSLAYALSTPFRPQSLTLSANAFGPMWEGVQDWIVAHQPANTVNTYRSQISNFNKWCSAEGVPSFPAPPDVLSAYAIHMLEEEHKKRGTIHAALSAVSSQYKLSDQTSPATHPLTKATMATIAKITPAPTRRKPLTVAHVLKMVERATKTQLSPTSSSSSSSSSSLAMPSLTQANSDSERAKAVRSTAMSLGAPITSQAILAGLQNAKIPEGVKLSFKDTRDIFLIILSMAAFLRESETTALRAEDVFLEQVPVDNKETTTLIVFVEKSKKDQERKGHTIVIAKGAIPALCPHAWFTRYLAKRNNRAEFLFHKTNNVEPLSIKTPCHIIKNWLKAIGVDPSGFGSHSARSGGASAAAAKGVEERLIKRHGNWRSDAVFLYIREPWDSLIDVTVF